MKKLHIFILLIAIYFFILSIFLKGSIALDLIEAIAGYICIYLFFKYEEEEEEEQYAG